MYSVQEDKRNCCLLKNESQPLLRNPFNYISSIHFFLLSSFSIIFIAVSKIKLSLVNWLLEVNRLLRSCHITLSVIRWGVGCISVQSSQDMRIAAGKSCCTLVLYLISFCLYSRQALSICICFHAQLCQHILSLCNPPFISLQYPSINATMVFCSEGWMAVICLKPPSKSSALARNGFLS